MSEGESSVQLETMEQAFQMRVPFLENESAPLTKLVRVYRWGVAKMRDRRQLCLLDSTGRPNCAVMKTLKPLASVVSELLRIPCHAANFTVQ
jgi:hypothetical protein